MWHSASITRKRTCMPGTALVSSHHIISSDDHYLLIAAIDLLRIVLITAVDFLRAVVKYETPLHVLLYTYSVVRTIMARNTPAPAA